MRRSRLRILCSLAVLICGVAAVVAVASVHHGPRYRQRLTPINFGGDDFADDVAVDSAGRTVVVGTHGANGADLQVSVAALRPNGRFDTTFSGNGQRLLGPRSGAAVALAIQPDRKIVIAAGTEGGVEVDRLNPDGTPDASFGDAGAAAIAGMEWPTGVALAPDGSIYVAANRSTFPVSPAVARLSPSGQLDAGFGDGGVARLHAQSRDDFSTSVAVESDGLPAVAYAPLVQPAKTAAPVQLSLLTVTGELDRSFGVDGIATPRFGPGRLNPEGVAPALLARPSGKLLLGAGIRLPNPRRPGRELGYYGLARLTPSGARDPGFAGHGSRLLELGTRHGALARDLALAPHGRIVQVGDPGRAGDGAAVRYLPSGRLDRSFSGNGIKRFQVGRGAVDVAATATGPAKAIDVAASRLRRGRCCRYEGVLVRLTPRTGRNGS